MTITERLVCPCCGTAIEVAISGPVAAYPVTVTVRPPRLDTPEVSDVLPDSRQ